MAIRDDRARVEQIVGECFVKAAHIVLSSRIYQSSRTLPKQSSRERCWFNLEIDEVECAQKEVEQWRRDIASPLLLEIFLLPWGAEGSLGAHKPSDAQNHEAPVPGSRTLLERWAIQWNQDTHIGRSQISRLEPAAIYKRLVIMLRSLFCYVRVLPAFRMYRACKRNRSSMFSLQYRLSKASPKDVPCPSFAPGSTGRLQHFNFQAVDTPYGSLQMGVEHQPSTAVTILEQATAPAAPPPQIITDYVGGSTPRTGSRPPPLRSSLSASLYASGSRQLPDPPSSPCITTGMNILRQPEQQQPPSPILRRHSWSLNTIKTQPSDPLSAAPMQHPSKQGPPTAPVRSTSMGASPHSPVVFGGSPQPRSSRGNSPQPFAPNTPGGSSPSSSNLVRMASTPPKYPGGLSTRVQQLAGHSGAKGVAAAIARGLSPSGRTAAAESASRGSPPVAQAVPEGHVVDGIDMPGCSSAARQISAPVCIPGSSSARRLHSSEDLRLLVYDKPLRQQGRTLHNGGAPASAPAAPSHLALSPKRPAAQAAPPAPKPAKTPFEAAAGVGERMGPGTPTMLQVLPSLGSESSSSISSFPASCSPQLPFAFTPTTQSYASAIDPQRREQGFGAAPSPPNKELGSLAVVRRPSWSARSSSFEVTLPGVVGYSVSPMRDSLDSSIFSSSTPRHPPGLPFSLTSTTSSPLLPPSATAGGPAGSSPGHSRGGHSGSGNSMYGPPRLTFPGSLTALAAEESEGDVLPFALDSEASLPSLTQVPTSPGQAPASPTGLASISGCNAEPDAAVGAFVRLIQEAPPLQRSSPASRPDSLTGGRPSSGGTGSSEMSLQAGLDQLQRLRMHLSTLPVSQSSF